LFLLNGFTKTITNTGQLGGVGGTGVTQVALLIESVS